MRLTMRIGTRLPIRARLTLLYGGLFMVAGAVLLGVTYVLLDGALAGRLLTAYATSRKVGAPATEAPGSSFARTSEVQALEDGYRAATLQSLLNQGGIALAVLTVVATLFGYLMAGRVLRPLNRISDTANRISTSSDLGQRLAFDGPRDEITRLADTFDSMLERLDKSFQDQQRFIANASHELRTPLAINRTLIEVALRRRTAAQDTKQLGASLLTVNARHERLIDGLLALAKGDRELAVRTRVELGDLAQHVADQQQGHARTCGVRLTVAAEPAPVSGDPVLLERVVHNLVENAIRYNTSDGWVRIATRRTKGGMALLVVTNTGPAVAENDLEAMFQPFRRIGTDRVNSQHGAGLGLAIVRAIVRSHAGTVGAHPREGGGLEIRIQLPLADPGAS
ncbi:HAMP domain-containing histidine kinase [Streptomyces sp. TRM66268-LWL]|uniref:histidine kinase n=1 Tax=Streptomyces polyasparticus TaxID=2767826 RepID=A0ABR7SX83_9ACTN|nr:HAMP domain-containing sensor histidine kinase [Streptomyces polyasparticus]MBC9719567.1 HAMP domain-containing histidine kinase [Streptomyces polyasparticus]